MRKKASSSFKDLKGGEGVKKLICVSDVQAFALQGQKVIYVDSKTIITPAAKDEADASGLEFSFEQNCCETKATERPKASEAEIDSDTIYTVLKALMDKGLLKGLLENLSGIPYVEECDSGGLKLVRGNSVQFAAFETGNPHNKVDHQELISKNDSSLNAGFLAIEKSSFDRELANDEIYYVIDGTVMITTNEKRFTAYSGDVVSIPAHSKVVISTPKMAKIYYVTNPVN